MSLIDFDERQLHYDMKDPCNECPFKKSTPPNRKGLDAEKLSWILDLMRGGDGSHSCHLSDPRSDCESAQSYTGPLQHCMGFARMMEKSHSRTGVIQRALNRRTLRPSQLKDPRGEVHSIRDLAETLKAWAEREICTEADEPKQRDANSAHGNIAVVSADE